jgi:hypothetical protein
MASVGIFRHAVDQETRLSAPDRQNQNALANAGFLRRDVEAPRRSTIGTTMPRKFIMPSMNEGALGSRVMRSGGRAISSTAAIGMPYSGRRGER